MDLNELKLKSNGARTDIYYNYEDSAEARWLNKPVLDSTTIFNGFNIDNVTLNGIGNIYLSAKQSQSMILCLETNTDIENISPRPRSILNFKLNHLDLSKYNRIATEVYFESVGFENFYVHFTFNDDEVNTNAYSIEPNKWVKVVWECPHMLRNDIEKFTIFPFLMGCPDEALPTIKMYVKYVKAELVEADYDLGWKLDKRIAYSHLGYLPQFKKEAITNYKEDDFFYLVNLDTGKKTKFSIKEKEYYLGNYYILDFSSVSEIGKYKIEIDSRETKEFRIDYTCFDSSIWKSLNFLRQLRCGEYVKGVHSACHLNCKTVHPENKKMVPNFGGWHDAGDVSQFLIPTAEITSSLLDLAKRLENDAFLNDRLLEESKVGLDWLLRTRFKDGYRAMAVLYRIHRHNLIDPTNEQIYENLAERGSFENFLASNALAKGAIHFANIDKIYAEFLKRCAIEDFDFAIDQYKNNIYTVRWGKPIECVVVGSMLSAASTLYQLTNNQKYIDISIEYYENIINCQETEKDIKGYFYEDLEHRFILSYEHRGHEQSPIEGLVNLFNILNDDYTTQKRKIKKSLELYRDYIIKTAVYSAPYDVIPAGVYNIDKVNLAHFTHFGVEDSRVINSFEKQIKKGVDLGDGDYLRIMPIAYTRRGFHATLLSKTKGVSMIAKLLNDNKLKNLVKNQIEWVLGKNPFSTSTMYGEGYNYHPLYVAFSRQFVGALPVGFKTISDIDAPYWPGNDNAVFKEVWGHTTAKFLWVLADIL